MTIKIGVRFLRAKGHSFGTIAEGLDMPRSTVAYIVSKASKTA